MEERTNADAAGAGAYEGAGARVLKEIIRTPAFLDIVRTNVKGLDRESAREVAKALIWEDMELSLGIVGTLPEFVNYLVAFAGELAVQMSPIPAELLGQYLSQAVSDIDVEAIRELPRALAPLVESAGLGEAAVKAFGGMVNAAAALVNRAAESNPHFIRDSVCAVDFGELGRASFAIMRSCTLWIASGISRMFRRRQPTNTRGDGF